MKNDVCSKLLYSGVPRWLATTKNKESADDLATQLGKSDPLGHIVTTGETEVKEIALTPSNKFEGFLSHLENMSVLGMHSPLPTLWKSPQSFSYASSQTATETMLPSIDIFQAEMRRWVELKIFRPVLESHGYEWKKHKVSITFGREPTSPLDDIVKIDRLRRGGVPVSKDSVAQMLVDAGYAVELEPETETQTMPEPEPEDPEKWHE